MNIIEIHIFLLLETEQIESKEEHSFDSITPWQIRLEAMTHDNLLILINIITFHVPYRHVPVKSLRWQPPRLQLLKLAIYALRDTVTHDTTGLNYSTYHVIKLTSMYD